MMTAPRLHVFGCGRAARALARRLNDGGIVEMGQIVNRTTASAGEAADFIGAGMPVADFDAGIEGGWLMLGLPDGALLDGASELAAKLPASPQLAFHLSGSVPAAVLAPLQVPTAAVHPLRAFADPAVAVDQFDPTWCVAEGDDAALQWLQPAFERAGGRWLTFRGRNKPAYHAATVAASNFLVTVNALARALAEQAGLDPVQAAGLLADLQHGTLAGLAERPAIEALTGPIERGDVAACRSLHRAVADSLDPAQANLFDALARATLDLAVRKRGRRPSDGDLEALYSAPPTSRKD